MNPVIGIVFCGFIEQKIFVSQTYVDAVVKSGGVPIVIPYISKNTFKMDPSHRENLESTITYYLKLCDGFLFCGGDDITPLLFGEELLTDIGKTDQKTDEFHLNFMKEVLDSGLPVLGICRGMQVLNLALGGTIYQDISFRLRHSLNHMQLSEDRSDICHTVSFSSNSLLCKLCGNTLDTNSFHHQCVRVLGQGLYLTGITSDGVIESIESTVHPFAVGVQWHPECMLEKCEPMQHLFLNFIKKAKYAKTIHLL